MEKLEIPFADVKVLDNFRTGLNSKCGYFASLKKEYYFVAHSQTFIKKVLSQCKVQQQVRHTKNILMK